MLEDLGPAIPVFVICPIRKICIASLAIAEFGVDFVFAIHIR
jgi:hypothetical protein